MLIEKTYKQKPYVKYYCIWQKCIELMEKKSYMKLAWKDVRCIVIKFHTTKMNFLLKNEK